VAGLLLGLLIGLARQSRNRWVAALAGHRLRRVLPQHAGAGADPVVLLRAADPAPFTDQPAGRRFARHLAQLGRLLAPRSIRGGIASIDRGQWEAARALGMTLSGAQAMRRIVLPQALKRMLPALTNRGIEIFKMTHARLGIVRLCRTAAAGQAARVADLQRPIEAYTVIAVIFFVCPAGRWCSCSATGSNGVWGGHMTHDAAIHPGRARHGAPRRPDGRKRFGLRPTCCAASTSTSSAASASPSWALERLGQEHAAALPQLHGDGRRRGTHRARRPVLGREGKAGERAIESAS
jgi:polar amino acid transport system permease protein